MRILLVAVCLLGASYHWRGDLGRLRADVEVWQSHTVCRYVAAASQTVESSGATAGQECKP